VPLRGFEVVQCVARVDIRHGTRSLSCLLQVSGDERSDVFGGRAFVDEAVDDGGNALQPQGEPVFHHDAGGRVAGDSSETTSSQPLEVVLAPLRPEATRLQRLSGRQELYIPASDPDSTIVIDALAARFGVTVESSALKSAGISVVVLNRDGTRANDYAALGANPGMLPKEALELALRGVKMAVETLPDTEVIVAASDPDKKLYSFEFRHRDGTPLPYNHNGNFHFATGDSTGRVLHGFDLRKALTDDVQLVIRVITLRSIRVLPFALSGIPLQPAPQKR
jgi:hypothetical protein